MANLAATVCGILLRRRLQKPTSKFEEMSKIIIDVAHHKGAIKSFGKSIL
jgi:hypothetical protein